MYQLINGGYLTFKNKKMKDNLTRGFPIRFNRDEFITPFDSIFDKFFNQSFPEISKEVGIDVFQSAAYPKCDFIGYDDRVEIIAEIPGLSKEQITIDVDGDQVSIKGTKNSQTSVKEGGTVLHRELKKSTFQRSFIADSNIFNLDKIEAKFSDGLLQLIIPKRETTEPTKRVIQIK